MINLRLCVEHRGSGTSRVHTHSQRNRLGPVWSQGNVPALCLRSQCCQDIDATKRIEGRHAPHSVFARKAHVMYRTPHATTVRLARWEWDDKVNIPFPVTIVAEKLGQPEWLES